MEMETRFSALSTLADLESVVNTRTRVWNIGGSGDTNMKLDTDVNNQEWYVLLENGGYVDPIKGMAPCWAFPHFNGSFDSYAYVPVAFCFKTFAEVLAACQTEKAVWAYDLADYAERLSHMPVQMAEAARKRAAEEAALDAMPPRTVEMSEREYRKYQAWQAGEKDAFDPFLDEIEMAALEEKEKPAMIIPLAFRQAFDDQPSSDTHGQLIERMGLWGLSNSVQPEEDEQP